MESLLPMLQTKLPPILMVQDRQEFLQSIPQEGIEPPLKV